MIHALAGKPAPKDLLIDADHLRREYYTRKPDLTDRAQRVSFGTSGHRGSSLRGSFNEWHVLAITQAICDYRSSQGISGPLYIGKDTHALSEPAFITALEVLAANGVETMIDSHGGYTPTPAVSHAILNFKLGRTRGLADGIVITPPPEWPTTRPVVQPPSTRTTISQRTLRTWVRPGDVSASELAGEPIEAGTIRRKMAASSTTRRAADPPIQL